MLSLKSQYYQPVMNFKRGGESVTQFRAKDGSHIIAMSKGKFYVAELGVTFIRADGAWELTHYCEKLGKWNDKVKQCLETLNEQNIAYDWDRLFDAQNETEATEGNELATM